jgi:HEAT repeat protein
VGLLPEAEIHSRSKDSTPYDMGHDERRYPVEQVLATAELASSIDLSQGAQQAAPLRGLPELVKALGSSDSGVRYWAAMGVLMRGGEAVRAAAAGLRKALGDAAPSVRVVAAEALGRFGVAEDLDKAVKTLVELAPPDKNGVYVAMAALNAIDRLGEKGKPAREALKGMPATDPAAPKRTAEYVPRLLKDLAGEK